MKKKPKIRNSHVYLGVILIIIIIAAIIIYSYHRNGIEKESSTLSDVVSLFDNGNQQEAIATLEGIIERNPSDSDAKNRLAMYYYQAKDYDKFLSFVQENNLDSSTISNMMANVYAAKQDKENAVKYYQLAINQSPKSTQNYVNFSAYYQTLGDYQSALDVLKSGLIISPNSNTLLNSAASVCLKMGNEDEAVQYAQRVLADDPENAQANAIIREAS